MCEESVVAAASTLLEEPLVEVLSRSASFFNVCDDDSKHGVDHEVNVVDTTSFCSVDFDLESSHWCHVFQRHQLVGQNVDDNQVATTIEHFYVVLQMLATYGWGTPVIDEHNDSSLSLTEFHTL